MPRNPSELARQDEMLRELASLRSEIRRYHWKARKVELLRQIRALEEQLDLEHVPYNSGEF